MQASSQEVFRMGNAYSTFPGGSLHFFHEFKIKESQWLVLKNDLNSKHIKETY